MQRAELKTYLLPFSLTGLILVLDQLTKYLVVKFVEYGMPVDRLQDFFLLVHQKNTGIAFSMGADISGLLRLLVFVALPLVMLVILVAYYFKTTEFTRVQRWALCSILGGGLGNLIDRVFRPEGVIDFLSFRIFGLFGMERWPTFNVADTAVVVGGLLILLTSLHAAKKSGSATSEA
ncbi:MAG: signal peptidase II [Spirochaetes bacterium GWD1_61_31]|nr:MAG: signal peptidase II [Spirochaetes bacterium GWB1_60_80]OHD32130.1 MAG: signal peptidase II [Spirochaetes bacterium GWC1_61_12]OHD37135.1 MAG: signal peptidase II [Spirochaetes bacterium GWD1_61_31]OHD42649.1 MAG: signal peptidase II [Spirochaetes bacterium GWE1_60_18]OHD58530.1 MAG: signal peptidase II [Spirochaetes bacterium GWF1_60_12]HAP43966.1 signal peptidase II [Spirochaetaceae bacterium]